MKIFSAAAVLLGLAAVGSAAPAPEPWCTRPGSGCWKVKRSVEVFSRAIRSSGGLEARSPEADFSNAPGGVAYAVKRAVDHLANVLALSSDNPEQYYKELGLEKEFEPDSGGKVKREALPNPWCTRPGSGCWKKRDATAVQKRSCAGAASVCWEDDGETSTEEKRWCTRPGSGCWKAKRAADAVLEAIGDDDNEALEAAFDPAASHSHSGARKREASPEPWCTRPGSGCWKVKRDLEAIRAAARSISAALE
ncbi:hypothetical protein DCS_08053 [Drechmeria coniospora]|uniref:Clock-controlled pheromone ccg-4 n=1 Tax=Drechmeria coniospora TaxID=98403 RepID=A0A151GG54_DRECN|nr:hypothetical protein DCS_08053 [Drechmeria coniospora]KYK56087.1 hypothetical protein DCS_08053 [Drechmeria coniospora]ODA77761.1 hypothetical protein RJ55_06363 [Drechmeria coniospora]